MFGFKFIKVQPTDYILLYKKGKLIKEGAGLSFFYFSPTTSLVRIPIASVDVPFIFNDVTSDFQEVTLQGEITYRISNPKQLSNLLNFSIESGSGGYISEDPEKLDQRLINHAQVIARTSLNSLGLKETLGAAQDLVEQLKIGLQKAEAISSLGIEILGVSILAIKPTPETSRALEADAREKILKEADEAIYSRRNAAVEHERAIKENELNTEIAVENKKRQIEEAKMDAEKSVQQKKRELREADMAGKITLEGKNKELVALSTENAKNEADAKAYGISAIMKSLSQTDPKILQALTNAGMKPDQLVAAAFKELAESAEKIGQLNISPDLLRELMSQKPKTK